ncbi:ATP-binding cassette domain-containing protein [Candidatus Gracilibacteria bacterium]|nr:ATP-binding cassette domain-containing protein [Candidatus Gracilibacteria bacterium]
MINDIIMLNYLEFLDIQLRDILSKKPKLEEFLNNNGLIYNLNTNLKIKDFFNNFGENFYIEKATTKQILSKSFYDFYISILKQENQDNLLDVQEITIIAGNNKYNKKENFSFLNIKRGEIISIVGPTGSGKSRLLADIEWMASKDTPTNREILVNGVNPPKTLRYSSDFKLVAQLSQNMNFIMDLTVLDFIKLHAESRGIKDSIDIAEKVIQEANSLAGENFDGSTPITSLSGGQSRALMIADVAILSKSPIVLIDEIENAGVDRKKALDLLVKEDKIILIATHDPILALLGNKRIVIKDGGIFDIIISSEQEKEILGKLQELDKTILFYREKLRNGEKLL